MGKSEVCTAESAPGLSEREIGSGRPESLHSAITDGERRPWSSADWLAKFGRHCTVPELLTERRPAVDTMREYALRGRYTSQLHGAVRALGIAWCRGVAIPGLVLARLGEHLTERPARFLLVAATVKALSFLPPVAWLVDHVIHPGADLALRVFL
ncbi:hypothetical protein O7598_31115 [Micromonospora sp. WMMC241]|uniref:hypothetical protein n=1 Tax=Micromonospora sp. WMMC241 TaxID=3015159 RepID=UPI0022B6736B|nr:hypothetical protein [Micromonospora sp. WMMC241]MCZ7440797.1 hypothetical protein [Micromonospora sp. WMMC241]MCZ7440876.1 hypothetical protein [Micromonospora sp. WMMC241]